MFCEIESNFKSVQFFFIHPVYSLIPLCMVWFHYIRSFSLCKVCFESLYMVCSHHHIDLIDLFINRDRGTEDR